MIDSKNIFASLLYVRKTIRGLFWGEKCIKHGIKRLEKNYLIKT